MAAGTDVNTQNEDGQTLHRVVSAGNLQKKKIVELLIANDADVNRRLMGIALLCIMGAKVKEVNELLIVRADVMRRMWWRNAARLRC